MKNPFVTFATLSAIITFGFLLVTVFYGIYPVKNLDSELSKFLALYGGACVMFGMTVAYTWASIITRTQFPPHRKSV